MSYMDFCTGVFLIDIIFHQSRHIYSKSLCRYKKFCLTKFNLPRNILTYVTFSIFYVILIIICFKHISNVYLP